MKTIAYIITRQHTGELIEDALLVPISMGQHDALVKAIYFIEDGVYHLVKGGRSAKNVKRAVSDQQIKIFGCRRSIRNRNLRNLIVEGLQEGDFSDFFKHALEADHVICI